MSKAIVSGGCSFAYGFNLDNQDHRYAKVIANAYGKQLIDVSVAGSSNENIGACMAMGINRALHTHDPKDIVAVVGWTDMMRYESMNKGLGYPQSIYVNDDDHQHGNPITIPKANAIFVAQRLWTPEWAYYKLVHAFNYVMNVCKAHSIPIVHTANISLGKFELPSKKVLHSMNDASSYTNQIIHISDKKAFDALFQGNSFLKMIQAGAGQYQIGVHDHHPNTVGHAEWARRIMSEHGNILGS